VLELTILAAKQGLGVIIISHNVMQIYDVTDRVVVLYKGRKVLDDMKSNLSLEEIINVVLTGTKK
jgi:ABC-type sugar transport system ATPase subunit